MRMNIGEVAALADVPTATVRYYERRGLIAEAPRTPSGYRQYGPGTAERVRFIKRAQNLGFSLEQIQEMLELRVENPAAAPEVEAKIREKVAQVRRKIRDLQKMEAVLDRLVASCKSRTCTPECPILDVIEP
jgi:Hg(II)-responsive transcriptional regulator